MCIFVECPTNCFGFIKRFCLQDTITVLLGGKLATDTLWVEQMGVSHSYRLNSILVPQLPITFQSRGIWLEHSHNDTSKLPSIPSLNGNLR